MRRGFSSTETNDDWKQILFQIRSFRVCDGRDLPWRRYCVSNPGDSRSRRFRDDRASLVSFRSIGFVGRAIVSGAFTAPGQDRIPVGQKPLAPPDVLSIGLSADRRSWRKSAKVFWAVYVSNRRNQLFTYIEGAISHRRKQRWSNSKFPICWNSNSARTLRSTSINGEGVAIFSD